MMGSFNGQDSVHAHTLRTTLVEHKQHSASLQVTSTSFCHLAALNSTVENSNFTDQDLMVDREIVYSTQQNSKT